MSYGRGSYYKFVKASRTGNYVIKGEQDKIVEYGEQTDYDFIEQLCKYWRTDDLAFKKWYIKKLSDRLEVQLLPRFEKRVDMWDNNEYDFEKEGLEVIDYIDGVEDDDE